MAYETIDWYRAADLAVVTAVSEVGRACAAATPDRFTVAWAAPMSYEDMPALIGGLAYGEIEPIRVFDEQFGTDTVQFVEPGSVLEVTALSSGTIELAVAFQATDPGLVSELAGRSKSADVAGWFEGVRGALEVESSKLVRLVPPPVPSPRVASCVCDVGTTTLKVQTWVVGAGPCALVASMPASLSVVVDNARVKPEWVEVSLKGLSRTATSCQLVAAGQARTSATQVFQSPTVAGPYNAQFDGFKAQLYPSPPGPATPALMRSALGQVLVR